MSDLKERAFEQRWIIDARGSNNKILTIIDDPTKKSGYPKTYMFQSTLVKYRNTKVDLKLYLKSSKEGK